MYFPQNQIFRKNTRENTVLLSSIKVYVLHSQYKVFASTLLAGSVSRKVEFKACTSQY